MIFKRTAAGIILAGLMLSMTGCGGSGSGTVSENTDGSSVTENGDAGKKSEEKSDEQKVYEAKSEWAEVKPQEGYIQIDDVLYPVFRTTADEFIKMLESSEVKYEYEYDASKTVEPGKAEKIIINRNGEEWITAVFSNMREENAALGSLTASSIYPSNSAMKCSRFIDGISYDEIMQMSHDDCVDYFNKLSEKYPDAVIRQTEESDNFIHVEIFGVVDCENSSAGNYNIYAYATDSNFVFNEDKSMKSFSCVKPELRILTEVHPFNDWDNAPDQRTPDEQCKDGIREFNKTAQYMDINLSDLSPDIIESAEAYIQSEISKVCPEAVSMKRINDYCMVIPHILPDGRFMTVKGGAMYELSLSDGSTKYIGHQWWDTSPQSKRFGYTSSAADTPEGVYEYMRGHEQKKSFCGFYVFPEK